MNRQVSSVIVGCIMVLGVVTGWQRGFGQEFNAQATDPATRKITQSYVYGYEEDDKDQSLVMEHGVAKVEYTAGKLTLTGADKKVLTSFKAGEKQLTVNFKAVEQRTDRDGKTLNVLVLESDDGTVFEFNVTPSSRMIHTLTDQKGNIVTYLKKKGGKPITDEKTK